MKKTLLICALVLSPIIFMSLSSLQENYFKIGSKTWTIDSAIVANESYGSQSKFELDLKQGQSDILESKTFIYLSISSSKSTELSDGLYTYGDIQDASKKFHGNVSIDCNTLKISDGSFSIEKENKTWNINCLLKLENGDVLKGSYEGKVLEQDRSSNYR